MCIRDRREPSVRSPLHHLDAHYRRVRPEDLAPIPLRCSSHCPVKAKASHLVAPANLTMSRCITSDRLAHVL
eukprot:6541528-Pyramimonas_sp.AAC.1